MVEYVTLAVENESLERVHIMIDTNTPQPVILIKSAVVNEVLRIHAPDVQGKQSASMVQDWAIEQDKVVNPYCEPQMSKYNLYRSIGGAGQDNLDDLIQQRMWVLNYSDSQTDLLTISDYSSFDILQLKKIADEHVMHNLIKEV